MAMQSLHSHFAKKVSLKPFQRLAGFGAEPRRFPLIHCLKVISEAGTVAGETDEIKACVHESGTE